MWKCLVLGQHRSKTKTLQESQAHPKSKRSYPQVVVERGCGGCHFSYEKSVEYFVENVVKMYNHRKTFSKELFDRHDQFAKDTVHSLVTAMNWELIDDTEAYGDYDRIYNAKGQECKVEVEQKMGWVHHMFPFNTLSVSHRKNTSKADLLFEVNAKGTAILMCPMSDVLSSPVIRKNTRMGTVNEPFYDVPISKCRFFVLEDGRWFEEFDD